jgi:glycosyltransferase involved in cell wall biosynthesis
MVELCRRENVNIWHAHDYKSNALGLLVRRFHPLKLVTTVHGWVKHTARTPLYYWIDRQCLPRYDRVICVSDDLYDACRQLSIPPQRLKLVHNAIDTDEFARTQDVTTAKRNLGIAPERFMIGAVGRLSPEKGFDRLIRVVAALVRRGVDLTLLIVGEGEQRAELDRLIEELGVGEHVRLWGYAGDVRPLFEAMDLFVLSSRREGLPNVVLEAMAMEVPLIATSIAGIPQLVQHQQNGLLVEPDNHDELFAAVQRMISEPDLRRRLAAEARVLVATQYSFARRMQKIRDIYDSLF